MGFELMENFNLPYISLSVKEFWSRWHISLSTWFRDYLYIPLGGSRVPRWRHCLNLLLVFLISGLWHGANWTFVIWGALHGIAVILGTMFLFPSGKTNGLISFFKTLSVFIFVTLTWVFFRADNFHDALTMIESFTKGNFNRIFGVPAYSLAFDISCIAGILIVFTSEYVRANKPAFPVSRYFSPRLASYSYFFVLLTLIYIYGIFEKQSFIYFQF
jgi:alginate O-acetyltransferase complex protein AlgI